MRYQNFIFDMGNVLMDFNPDYLLSVFVHDIDDIQMFKSKLFSSGLWARLDNGDCDFDDAYDEVSQQLPLSKHATLKRILNEWTSTKYPRKDMEEIVKRLKDKGYGIYLCSNVAPLFHTYKDHYEIFNYFDGFVLSGDLKLSKPDPKIYEYLLVTFKLDPKSCLFIDDINANILGANTVGIDGYHYNGNGKMFEMYLENIGVL